MQQLFGKNVREDVPLSDPTALAKFGRLEVVAKLVVEGYLIGQHKSPFKGASIEFVEHRHYYPGDEIRHIDWRVFGKTDRYFIKEYEEETNMRVHLLLDCSASMAYPEHPGTGRMTKWTYAATVAASLAHLLVHQQDGVGLTLFDHGVRRQIPVSANPASLHAFASLIEAHAPNDKTDMKSLFHQLAGRLPPRGMVVILSDLLTDVTDIIRGLQRFRYGNHDVLVMHILDHDELEFPFTDRTLFEGMEDSAVEVLTDPQSLRSSYLAALQGFISQVRTACLDQRIDYCLMSTAEGLDVALTTYLASRMRRRRSKA